MIIHMDDCMETEDNVQKQQFSCPYCSQECSSQDEVLSHMDKFSEDEESVATSLLLSLSLEVSNQSMKTEDLLGINESRCITQLARMLTKTVHPICVPSSGKFRHENVKIFTQVRLVKIKFYPKTRKLKRMHNYDMQHKC